MVMSNYNLYEFLGIVMHVPVVSMCKQHACRGWECTLDGAVPLSLRLVMPGL